MERQDFDALLSAIPGEAGELLADIQLALNGDDLDGARRAAHSLKGLASNFSALRIAALARHIELDAATVAEAEIAASDLGDAIEQTRELLANGS